MATVLQGLTIAQPRNADKHVGGGWSPATFKGDTRGRANVISTWGLGFDVDVEPVPDLATILAACPWRGAVHQTWSHRHECKSNPRASARWRIVIELNRDVTSEEHDILWAHVASLMQPSVIVGAAKDASRFWFPPCTSEDGSFEAALLTGAPLDVDAMLAVARASGTRTPMPPPAIPTSEDGPKMFDPATPEGAKRLAFGIEAAKTFPPSQEDGHGSQALMTIMRALKWQCYLSQDVAVAVLQEHWNTRCTNAEGYQKGWEEKDLRRAYRNSEGGVAYRTVFDWQFGNEWFRNLPAKMMAERRAGTWDWITSTWTDAHKSPADDFFDNMGSAATGDGSEVARRRVPDPDHQYTFSTGDLSAVEARRVKLTHVLATLYRSDDWAGVLQYDEFAEQAWAVDPPGKLDAEKGRLSNNDYTRIQAWLEHKGFLASDTMVTKAVQEVIHKHTFHSVREYLEALPKGDVSILDDLSTRLFGTSTELENTLVRKFLVAAVRRIKNPGEKVDYALTLHGEQDLGKSGFVKLLFHRWAGDDMKSLDNENVARCIQGKWCTEIAELEKVLRVDPETAKSFITRIEDRWVPKFEEQAKDHPRQCVFVGTTNRHDFLRDVTGERRWWVIKVVKHLDFAWLAEHRDAIWAAARDLEATGVQHFLTAEEKIALRDHQAEFRKTDYLHDAIQDYLHGREVVTTAEVAGHLEFRTNQIDDKIGRRITDTLTLLGCVKASPRINGKQVRGWRVPTHLAGADLICKPVGGQPFQGVRAN